MQLVVQPLDAIQLLLHQRHAGELARIEGMHRLFNGSKSGIELNRTHETPNTRRPRFNRRSSSRESIDSGNAIPK
ncbi:hypothetical protein D3C86_2170280 [compost metagenome]